MATEDGKSSPVHCAIRAACVYINQSAVFVFEVAGPGERHWQHSKCICYETVARFKQVCGACHGLSVFPMYSTHLRVRPIGPSRSLGRPVCETASDTMGILRLRWANWPCCLTCPIGSKLYQASRQSSEFGGLWPTWLALVLEKVFISKRTGIEVTYVGSNNPIAQALLHRRGYKRNMHK